MPIVMSGGSGSQSGADLAILAELLAEMSGATSVEQITASLARSAKWIVPNEWCTLLLCDDDGRSWHLHPGGSSGRITVLPEPVRNALERSVSIRVIREDDDLADKMESQLYGSGWRSAIVLPLKGAQGTFGTLNLGSARRDAYPVRPAPAVELLRMNVAAVVQSAQRLSQAEKLSELRSRLVATVSHDYKGPLAAIIGFSDLLLAREFSRPRQEDMLELIRAETLRLNSLVSEVLDLSALTLRGGDVRREELDLAAMIDYCLSTYRADEGERTGHTFAVEIAPDLPPAFGDPTRITQVLMNLIGNAVKYSPNGGEIVASISVDPVLAEVQVAITDSGMGMDPREIGKLFQPFERTTAAVSSGIEGTGLGLAICQEIAVAHGGRLWAESGGLGYGSTFVLALPAEVTPAGERLVAAISA